MMFENENTPFDMLIETYAEQQEIKTVINELIQRSNSNERLIQGLYRQISSLNKLLSSQTQMLTRMQMAQANTESKMSR